MNILLLSDRLPWPLEHGVNLRIYHLAKYLSRYCDIDLVCFSDEDAPKELHCVFNRIEIFSTVDPVTRHSLFDKLINYVAINNLHAPSSELQQHVNSILNTRHYDIVWAYTFVMMYLPKGSLIPIVSDVIDDAVLQFWRSLKSAKYSRHVLPRLRYLLMHWRFERRYFSPDYVDAAFLTSQVDADVLRRICPQTHIKVIENGVDTDLFKPTETPEIPDTLVFEGNMTHGPNAEGALFFCREVLPLIRKHRPQVTLTLVGKDPSPELLALGADPSIRVTGFVDDVRPYLASAAVFVCPLLSGGGIKNKLLQAWSMGKACVTTSMSTGGLLVKEGENILVRDSASAFAEATVELLIDREYRRRLGVKARETAISQYGWEEKSRQLFKLFEGVISSRQTP